MVKITLEFPSLDAAIVGLGKLVGTPVKVTQPVAALGAGGSAPAQAPASPTTTKRKGRSDKGQARGANAATTQKSDVLAAAPSPATQSGKGDTSASPAAPAGTSGTTDGEKPSPSTTPETANTAGSTTATQEACQQALEGVFNKHGAQLAMDLLARHGVKRVRELKPEQFTDFVKMSAEALEKGVV